MARKKTARKRQGNPATQCQEKADRSPGGASVREEVDRMLDTPASPAKAPLLPKGAKGPAGRVYVVRAGCPVCASGDVKRRAIVREIEWRQQHEDGNWTTRRRWQRAQCKCGQHFMLIEDFNP